MNILKEIYRNVRRERVDRLYHEKSIKSAQSALRNLEKQRGILPERIRKQCDEYAVDVLKDRRYAPWFYVYSVVAGEFREGWLAANYWGRVVVPRIQGEHGRISRMKSISQIVFRSDNIPDLLSYANGVFYDKDGRIYSSTEVEEVLFSSGDRVVFKSDQSRKGAGVRILHRGAFDIDEFLRQTSTSGVFQSFIDQEEGLSAFYPEAVSTLRLNTVINVRGATELRSAYLRLGTGRATHVAHGTQIRIAVSVSTGSLDDTGFTDDWLETDRHPDSGLSFSNFDYPNFMEAVDVVKRLHRVVPFVRCIGWDVCVDRSGKVRIMEWNGRQNAVQFPEATQGPCFLGLDW